MLKYKVNFDKLEWEHPIEGVKCKLTKHGSKQLRLIEYTKKMPPHWCEKGHYGMVLDGELEIEFQNEKNIYKSGDGVFIPNGLEHKHKGLIKRNEVYFDRHELISEIFKYQKSKK